MANPIVADARTLLRRFGDGCDSSLIVDADVAEKINECDEAIAIIFDEVAGRDPKAAESAMKFIQKWLYFEPSFTRQHKDMFTMVVRDGAERRGENAEDAVEDSRPSILLKLEANRMRQEDHVAMLQLPRNDSDSDDLMNGESAAERPDADAPRNIQHAHECGINQGVMSGMASASLFTRYAADVGVMQVNHIFAGGSDAVVPPPIPSVPAAIRAPRGRLNDISGRRGRRMERDRDARRFGGDWNEPHERSRSGRRYGHRN